jgi:putative DNA primase/helicase
MPADDIPSDPQAATWRDEPSVVEIEGARSEPETRQARTRRTSTGAELRDATHDAAPVSENPADGEPFDRGDHVEIGERLISDLRKVAPVVHCDGEIYQYAQERGIWRVLSEAELSSRVQGYAGALVKKKRLRLKAGDVVGAVKLAGHRIADPEHFQRAAPVVVFRDGAIEVSAEGIRSLNHSPEHRARFAYDHDYQPDAHPVAWLSHLRETFGSDDCDARVMCLQEYVGVSLLGRGARFHRALFLVGEGRNGKGVIAKVIDACAPPGSVCSVTPQLMGQEYRRAELAGKLLNVVGELPETEILETEHWKAVVAGDRIEGRAPCGRPFTHTPIAGHVYSCNRLPGINDQSPGMWERPVILECPNIVPPERRDVGLADRLIATEASGVVSWFLRGAQRLLARGSLTIPPSSTAAVERWRFRADQVRQFLAERTVPLDPQSPADAGTRPSEVYAAYREWAPAQGHRVMAANRFGERANRISPTGTVRGVDYYRLRLTGRWGQP